MRRLSEQTKAARRQKYYRLYRYKKFHILVLVAMAELENCFGNKKKII